MGLPRLPAPLALIVLLVGPPVHAAVSTATVRLELSLQFSHLGRASASATSTGLATVHTSSGLSSHLSTITLPGASLVTAVPVTDPAAAPITTVAFDLRQAGGPIGNVSGALASGSALTPNTLPMTGLATLCLISGGWQPCVPQLNLPMGGTSMGRPAGAGVGGILTLGGLGTIRISMLGAPFTVGTVSAVARTANAGLSVLARHGFAHGPLSLTSSTAQTSGVLQILTATHLVTVGPGDQDLVGMISRTTIHFLQVPEPALPVLLATGAVALAVLGMRRSS